MLGFRDVTPATPFGADHTVGIWTSTGTLLGSASVLTNSPIDDGFRYVNSPFIVLSAGQLYVTGGEVFGDVGGDDNNYVLNATVVTAPELTFIGSRTIGGATLTFPSASMALGGRFGPNFQFVDATVPEPTSMILFATGVLATGVRRLITRRSASRNTKKSA